MVGQPRRDRVERLLPQVVDHLDECIVLSDGREILWANQPVADLIGYTREELVEMHHEDILGLIHPEDRQEIANRVLQRVRKGTSIESHATRLVSADGVVVPVRVTIRPIDENLVVVTFEDRTEHVQAERELENKVRLLDRRSGDLRSVIETAYHDLREGIRDVHAHGQRLERQFDGDLDDETACSLDRILDGARRLDHYIRALSIYASVQEEDIDPRNTDTETCLRKALDQLETKVDRTDADVRVDDLPPVRADRKLLVTLFRNLVDNVITHAGDEPPEVEIHGERDGEVVDIRVRDHGPGVPEEDLDQIFHVFQRGTTWNDQAGTGMGLALCRRIVAAHDGRIWAESLDDGLQVQIRLPAADADLDGSPDRARVRS